MGSKKEWGEKVGETSKKSCLLGQKVQGRKKDGEVKTMNFLPKQIIP